jgi:ABC-type branched-subunit amino acid transport system substrate-binding protein
VPGDVSRRDFLKWAGAAGIVGAGALSGVSCGKSSEKAAAPSGTNKGFGSGGGSTLKVGVIAPLSGVGAFVGRIVNNSLDAAVDQINSTGGVGGRKVEVLLRDSGTDPAAGVKAYQSFAGDRGVIGVLWCGAGLEESRAQIQRDGMPVISVFVDLWSEGKLYPNAPERSIFQMIMPDKMAIDLLVDYAANDRGYDRVSFMYDTLLYSPVKAYFEDALKKYKLSNGGIETYQLNDSDFGAQLQRLKNSKSDALFIWGLAGDTAGIVKQIDRLGASYIDTPTAKGTTWRPQILGSPGGTGEKTWAELAGSSAKAGTLTAWHVGGLVALPSFAIRQWIQKFLGKRVTGGEESPADGLATLVEAVKHAGSTDRQKMVTAIETMGPIKFASIPFSYSKDRHLSKTRDDLILVTLERSSGPATTDPPYQLGTEWKEVFPAGYVGPTQLVRPTLEANRRAHPDVIDEVLRLGYGTQCTKMPDGSLSKVCKIH